MWCWSMRSASPPTPNSSRRADIPDAMSEEPQWLTIAREVRAIAQTGLTFTADGFDHQRYRRLQELAALLLAQGSAGHESILQLLRQEKGYATPKVDVRGAAFVEGRVLMVVNGRCPAAGPMSINQPANAWCAKSPKSRASRPVP